MSDDKTLALKGKNLVVVGGSRAVGRRTVEVAIRNASSGGAYGRAGPFGLIQ